MVHSEAYRHLSFSFLFTVKWLAKLAYLVVSNGRSGEDLRLMHLFAAGWWGRLRDSSELSGKEPKVHRHNTRTVKEERPLEFLPSGLVKVVDGNDRVWSVRYTGTATANSSKIVAAGPELGGIARVGNRLDQDSSPFPKVI